jgi:hypothetical protein
MPSGKVPSFTDYAGAQAPVDVAYICKSPFGVTDDRFSTLNDLFSIITKNITDLTVRFQDSVSAAPAVSSANTGALNYNGTTDTFQGSRNGSAYTDLLFGAGSNTQIAYWSTLQDELNGSASWTYNDSTKTTTLSHSNNLPNLIVQNTSAATPNTARIQTTFLQVTSFDATGNGGVLNLFGGRTGSLFPLATATLGGIYFAGVNAEGVGPTTRGGGRIEYVATSNLSLTEGGSGMVISSIENGAVIDTIRFTITGSGAVIVGANGTGPTASLGGTSTLVSIGNLTTYDAAGAIQVGNPQTGPTTIKTLVVQANPLQTASIIETQSSGGGGQFQVRVSAGNGNHFLSLLGNSGSVPAVSVAAQWRIYCSAAGRLMLSENGGAYTTVVTGTGSGMAIGNTITSATAGSVLFAGAAGVLAQDNSNLFWDDSNNYLGLGVNSSLAARLHVRADAGNNGIHVESNTGAIQGVYTSDGSTLLLGGITNHTLEITTNGTARLSIGGTGSATFLTDMGVQSAAAASFYVGPTGNTNPTFRIVSNVASAATGLSITGNAVAGGVTLGVLSPGADESIRINPLGDGGVGINIDPLAPLHVLCRATSNEGIRVESNNGSVEMDWFSDGSIGYIGTTTNHDFQLLANGTTIVWCSDPSTGAIGFLGALPAVRQTGGAATAGVTYTATEQDMLQKAYDCLRTFGLLT